MPIYTWSAIYLGNAADMDPDDADFTAENAGDLLGTYGSVEAPLKNNIVDVVVNDADGDTDINYDDPAETLEIDGVNNTLDSGAVFNATITYMDGTTATITAVIMQTSNGDLYLAPELSDNADKAAMEAGPIRSLTLDSLNTDSTTLAANRQQTSFACFAAGTRIQTPNGDVPVEKLRAEELVTAWDGRHCSIRRMTHQQVSLACQLSDARKRAVLIRPGAFGEGAPNYPLRVSQQHRLLICSPVAQRMFGSPEVLVAAKKLVGFPGIELDLPRAALRYYHIALQQHEIIRANGALAETLYPGPLVRELLPVSADGMALPINLGPETAPARPIIEGRRLKSFLSRLQERQMRRGARNLSQVDQTVRQGITDLQISSA